MTAAKNHFACMLLSLAAALLVPAAAVAQQAPPNALQGFSQNRDQPVHIEATTLEVRDKNKVATFFGNVHVIQGDTDMRCKSLVVYYDEDNQSGGMKSETPGPGGQQQQIKRLEARGNVVVTQKDQTATGDSGNFDMKSNTVTLTGNVVMTQGQNVVRGDRLVVDLTTGLSRVESGKSGQGRVQGLFYSSGGARPDANASPETPKPAPVPAPGAGPAPAPGSGPAPAPGSGSLRPGRLY